MGEIMRDRVGYLVFMGTWIGALLSMVLVFAGIV